jgi:flagellar biosynthetic protein FliR
MDFASAVFGGSLAFVRIAAMIFTAPVLGHRSVPLRIKAILALGLTTVTFPLLNQSTVPTELNGWTQSFFSELTIGIFLGLGVQIVFAAAQMTGTVISQMAAIQIGGGTDTMGGEGSPVSKLFGVLSIAAFILLSGPEHLVGATIDTFVSVPVGTPLKSGGLVDLMIELLRQSFLLTLRGVAPAVGAMMISTFVIGLISRNYPQINLLNLGLTTNLGVMMLSLMFTLGGCVWLFADDFQQVLSTIQNAIVAANGLNDSPAAELNLRGMP